MSIFLILFRLFEYIFAGLRKLGIELVHQVLRIDIAVALYHREHERIYQMVCLVVVDSKGSNGYENRATYIWTMLHTNRFKCVMVQARSPLSTFDMELYHYAHIG